jgi:hypothetical protein
LNQQDEHAAQFQSNLAGQGIFSLLEICSINLPTSNQPLSISDFKTSMFPTPTRQHVSIESSTAFSQRLPAPTNARFLAS